MGGGWSYLLDQQESILKKQHRRRVVVTSWRQLVVPFSLRDLGAVSNTSRNLLQSMFISEYRVHKAHYHYLDDECQEYKSSLYYQSWWRHTKHNWTRHEIRQRNINLQLDLRTFDAVSVMILIVSITTIICDCRDQGQDSRIHRIASSEKSIVGVTIAIVKKQYT